jgi:hypothetical protein
MVESNRTLFKLVVDAEKVHPDFKALKEWEGAVSARDMLNEIYQTFDDPEGNFLEQFQTTAFNSRFFELYLFAYLSRSGFTVTRRYPNPDFVVSRNGLNVAIEATTVNPASSGVVGKLGKKISELSPNEYEDYIYNELAIRFGSPLFSKLKERYWELEHCRDIPVVLAIEAFHDKEALAMSDFALSQYVYGLRQSADWSADGNLDIKTSHVDIHTLGEKKIPSNFFKQPDAENISAIIFTNSGTFSKFARMGFHQGFGCDVLHINRSGYCFNPDPNAMDPTFFSYNLDDPPFVESWGQGLVVLHNPNCLRPIPKDFFVDAVQGYIEDGILKHDHTYWHPISSKTLINYMGEAKKTLQEVLRRMPRFAIAAISQSDFRSLFGFFIPFNPVGEEHGWFCDETESFLGVIIRDKIDNDWGYVILGRDEYAQFRAIETEFNFSSRHVARAELQIAMAKFLSNPERIFPQGSQLAPE